MVELPPFVVFLDGCPRRFRFGCSRETAPRTTNRHRSTARTRSGGAREALSKKGRYLVLTEFGQQVFQYADDIFATGRELQAFVSGALKPTNPRFVVGMPNVVPKLIAFRLLQPAFHLTPKVQTICHEGKLDDLLADLALHRLDLVLSDGPDPKVCHAAVAVGC
jgi:LysR family transcriptional activator of nhaA